MAVQESMKSSVNSNSGESPYSPYTSNFVKYLYKNNRVERAPYYQQDYSQTTPILRRNQSYNSFGHSSSPRTNQRPNIFHNRFYESLVQSTTSNKHTAEFPKFAKQFADYSASLISKNAEHDLLKKQIKRLKQEVQYLTQKSQKLQRKNQKLIIYKSRAQILDREYQVLLRQYNRMKESSSLVNYHTDHVPLSLEQIDDINQRGIQGAFNTLRGKEVNSRIMPGETSQNNKVFMKKVSGGRTYKTPYDDLPLLESKVEIDKQNDQYPSLLNNRAMKEDFRSIELRQLSASQVKKLQRKCQDLQKQIVEIRRKNIDLYKKCEQFQGQKLKYLQNITELKYQKSKQLTSIKDKQSTSQKELQKLILEKQANNIQILELKEQISNDYSQLKMMKLEKQQYQNQLKQLRGKLDQMGDYNSQKHRNSEFQNKCKKVEKQFDELQKQWVIINQKNEQNQIYKKLLQQELQQKRQYMSRLEKQIKDKQKTGQLPQQSKPSQIQPPIDNPIHINTLISQIALLRDQNRTMTQQTEYRQFQIERIRRENQVFNDKHIKLSKALEIQKQQNMKLNELRQSWRQLEVRARALKQIDGAVDHLWQIKQVQYENVHSILNSMNFIN